VKAISPEASNITLELDEIPDLSAHFHLAEYADWESWVQASNVDLCEVRLGFDGLRTCKFCDDAISTSNTETAALDLSTSPLPPLRCDAHPLSSMVFCPGDPQNAVTAESSSGPVTPKMYLCLSLLSFGPCALGMENPTLTRIDSTIPQSELVVFSLSRRVHPNGFVSEWVRFSLLGHAYQGLIIHAADVNKINIKSNVRDPDVHLAPPRIPTFKRNCRRQSECSRARVFKKQSFSMRYRHDTSAVSRPMIYPSLSDL
jgi:hypothetical protein